MLIEIILLGLICEMAGVIILVKGAHSGFDYVLRHVGKDIPKDWDDEIKKIHWRNEKSTIIGVFLLIAGIVFQISGIMVECVPIIFGCNISITV